MAHLHAFLGNQGVQDLLDARLASRPAPVLPSWHEELGERVEEVGRTSCDLDQAKMTWSVDVAKLPLCMSDCAKDHELAHVKFGQKECASVSAVYKVNQEATKKVDDALAKAKASGSKADLDKVEAAVKELEEATRKFEQAEQAYEKWFNETCRASEEQAYQAGIDTCNKPEIKKQCADIGATETYKKEMELWEKFKKNPPNCTAAPPKEPAKEKAKEEPKQDEKKKEDEKKKDEEKKKEKGKTEKH